MTRHVSTKKEKGFGLGLLAGRTARCPVTRMMMPPLGEGCASIALYLC